MINEEALDRRSDIEALLRERDRLLARVAELEGTKAALEAELERLSAALSHARREVIEGRAAVAELEAARSQAEEAHADAMRLRRQAERVGKEQALTDRVHEAATRLAKKAPSATAPPKVPPAAPRWATAWLSPRTGRRLSKLRRDPKQFLEDSKFPLVRRLGRLVFR